MSKKKNGPDPFEWRAVNAAPADPGQATAWLVAFIDCFVRKEKRERARELLMRPDRRMEGLRDLWSWVDPGRITELTGSSGFPQHLEPLLGNGAGIYFGFDGRELVVSAAEAAMLASSDGLCALFLLDGGRTALQFGEVGPPTLLR